MGLQSIFVYIAPSRFTFPYSSSKIYYLTCILYYYNFINIIYSFPSVAQGTQLGLNSTTTPFFRAPQPDWPFCFAEKTKLFLGGVRPACTA